MIRFFSYTRRTAVLFLLSFFPFVHTDAQSADKLQAAVQELLRDEAMKNGMLGFSLVRCEDGQTLYAYNDQQSLVPASVMKVATTAAALGILGEDYRFETILAYSGNIDKNGILHGNLYIQGGGDPTLGSDRVKGSLGWEALFQSWQEALTKAGIKRIEGSIIGDASRYEEALLPATWAWNDMGNYYGAGACGLSFRENMYVLYLRAPSEPGSDVDVLRTDPEVDGLTFHNYLKTGAAGSGDSAYIYGAPYTYLRQLLGTVPPANPSFAIKGSVPDPALYCVEQFKKYLDAAGIHSQMPTTQYILQHETAEKLTKIHSTLSPPLKDIVAQTNLKSLNLYAEHMLKEMGYKQYKEGSTVSGIKAVMAYWKNKGIDLDGFYMQDGSGLSRFDGITARQLSSMLAAVKNEKYFSSFYVSLPVAGESGALRNIGKGSGIQGKLRAKSGHMDRVRSYSGYIQAKDGKWLAFAFILNNYNASSMKIMVEVEKVLSQLDL